MEAPKLTGLKKRQQIQQANRTMFIWVAAAAVAVAVCLVLAQFMVRQLMYNNKIIGEKTKVQATLDKNLTSFEALKQDVLKLTANQNLTDLRADKTNDTALQVVIDALPTTDDRATLGTSLQQVILARSGVPVSSIDVTQGVSQEATATVAATSKAPSEIAFQVVLTGTYDQVAAAIKDMERAIRPINFDVIQVQGTGKQLRTTISARTYYLPSKTVEVTQKTVKP